MLISDLLGYKTIENSSNFNILDEGKEFSKYEKNKLLEIT